MIRTIDLKENFAYIKKESDKLYIVGWNYKERQDGYASWMFNEFNHKPTIKEIKEVVINSYNREIDDKILKGFVWNDMHVWLSSENQFNYKAAYDLAVQTEGESLPVTFKFGSTIEPVYYTFTNLDELKQFYMAAITYINATLADGWVKKDSIDWSVYEINE